MLLALQRIARSLASCVAVGRFRFGLAGSLPRTLPDRKLVLLAIPSVFSSVICVIWITWQRIFSRGSFWPVVVSVVLREDIGYVIATIITGIIDYVVPAARIDVIAVYFTRWVDCAIPFDMHPIGPTNIDWWHRIRPRSDTPAIVIMTSFKAKTRKAS